MVEHVPIAANVLGTIGTVFWCVQLVPQIYANWKHKQTDGLPSAMMLLWAISGVPFGTYAVVQHFNTPLQIQPQLFCALSLVSWVQILVYKNGWTWLKASAYGVITALVFGGVEAALILTLRPLYDRGIGYPMIIVGVIASILLAAGLLPPYHEMWKRHGRVVGISFFFLSMDWLGAFFSLMALVAQREFDVLGAVLYIVCIVLEIGIFLSHLIWLFRTRKLRAGAVADGKTFDDILQEKAAAGEQWQHTERQFKFRSRKGQDIEDLKNESSLARVDEELRLK